MQIEINGKRGGKKYIYIQRGTFFPGKKLEINFIFDLRLHFATSLTIFKQFFF